MNIKKKMHQGHLQQVTLKSVIKKSQTLYWKQVSANNTFLLHPAYKSNK